MANSPSQALQQFTQNYIDLWQQQAHHTAKSSELYGIPSPCIVDTQDLAVFWQPIRPNTHTLNIVEEVINLTIHPAAHQFYGTQYAGDMTAIHKTLPITLIQVWSEDDFSRLEQNIIAHLTMQKRLKRRPSIFIASTDDDTKLVAIDNQTGNVILENLIDYQNDILAEDLSTFLLNLKPIAQSLLSGV